MPRRRNQASSVEDLLAFLEALPRVRLGASYTEQDRARDFIRVFTTDEGRRVLSQIHEFCSPVPSPLDADKPGTLAFKEGRRWVLGEIMRAFVARSRVPTIEKEPRDGA